MCAVRCSVDAARSAVRVRVWGGMRLSDRNDFLLGVARRQAALYVAHTRPVAILLAGSAATGDVDGYADLDLICYYATMPPEAWFRAARERWQGATGVRHDPWNEV